MDSVGEWTTRAERQVTAKSKALEDSMSIKRFATLARNAADATSRRRALLTLGSMAAASTLSAPSPSHAGKIAKRAKKRKRKKCNRQIDQCREAIVAHCEGEESCINNHEHCCPLLSDCNARASLDCFFGSLG